jgi:heterodisulfide reductase subunit D
MTPDMKEIKKIISCWFTPIQMLELDACTKCQECVSICPTVTAGFCEGAMERIQSWQKLIKSPYSISSLLEKKVDFEVSLHDVSLSLSRCTSCGICAVVCESGIQTAYLWESMRGATRDLGFHDDVAAKKAETIIRKKNPYDEDQESRNSWIPADHKMDDGASIALFTGCTLAFRNPETARAALRILDASGTRFTVLDHEYCCGSFLFRTGTWKEYTDPILEVIQDINDKGITEVLVPCAGCLKTLTMDWPKVCGTPLPFKVTSFASFIREKIGENQIQLSPGEEIEVIYHDPCHGARHLMHHLGEWTVFEAPREVISAIPNTRLIEFPKNRQFQSCCGAGAGVKSEDPEMAGSIASEKLKTAKKLGADTLVSTCPFCERNFSDANDTNKDSLEVVDLIELVDRAIKGSNKH